MEMIPPYLAQKLSIKSEIEKYQQSTYPDELLENSNCYFCSSKCEHLKDVDFHGEQWDPAMVNERWIEASVYSVGEQ
jgi:hypothetical protein